MEFVQPIRDRKKIESIKKVLKSLNNRDYLLFVMGINSGLRIGDLLRLNISDVVDENRKIKDRISIREQKTGKSKNFPISNNVKKILNDYTQNMAMNDPLFPSRKGVKAITRQQAYRILNDVARTVGITDKIGTHTLRKTFAYHALKSGYDVIQLQKLFGHSAPSITMHYAGIEQDELDEIYLNLNL
ncbi:MAG: site-specific integrase [Eubacteriales bacterium]